jgi:hypothetical protein
MSFVTWLALPIVITLVASLIMILLNKRPRTNTHQDIENFARFRATLARRMAAPPPPGTVPLSSSRAVSPPGGEQRAEAADSPPTGGVGSTAVASNATIVEDRRRPARTGARPGARAGVAASPER